MHQSYPIVFCYSAFVIDLTIETRCIPVSTTCPIKNSYDMTSVLSVALAFVLITRLGNAMTSCSSTSNHSCVIECSALDASCKNQQIYVDDTAARTDILCNGTESCSSLTLIVNNTQTANVHCLGFRACRLLRVQSTGASPSHLSIICDGSQSCSYGVFLFESPRSVVNIDCDGDSACLDTVVSAMPISALTLRCLTVYACWETAVYAPLLQPNSSLDVLLSHNSVRGLVIYHPDLFSAAYQDRVRIVCNTSSSTDCQIYGGAQGVFVLYGAQMSQYCRLMPDNDCPALGSTQAVEMGFVYADDRSLDTNMAKAKDPSLAVMIFIASSAAPPEETLSGHDVITLVALESHDVVYDLSSARDAVLHANRMDCVTVYGPSGSFAYIEWFGYSTESTLFLNATESISVPCLGCPFTSQTAGDPYASPFPAWTTLHDSRVFVGESVDVHVNCADNSAKDCSGLRVFSDLDVDALASVSLVSDALWNISCDGEALKYNKTSGQYTPRGWNCEGLELHFADSVQCAYNRTYPCPEYLWTLAPTLAPTACPLECECQTHAQQNDVLIQQLARVTHQNDALKVAVITLCTCAVVGFLITIWTVQGSSSTRYKVVNVDSDA